MSDSTINVFGNLTKDPELRFTSGGKPVCNASVAVNNRTFRDGQWVDGEPLYLNLVVWGQMGENLAASATKGSRVMVSGRLEQRNWEDGEKNKRVSYEVIVDEIGASFKWATLTIEKTNRAYATNVSQPVDRSVEEPF